jgi:uncharacterized protein YkwD
MSRIALTRVAALTFALVVSIGALGVTPAPAAAADISIGDAERLMIRLLNAKRTQAGLVKVRIDGRLQTIAGRRSADMASKHYFSHSQPDGRSVFDLLNASGMSWYSAGEIIAWNSGYSNLTDSAAAARDGWMASPGHRSIVMSNDYNYVGVGLSIDASNGKRLWTAVFAKRPDHTGGWVTMGAAPRVSYAPGYSTTRVKVKWTGGDIRLVVLTAGFRFYQTQVRTDGGRWKWVSRGTTTAYRSLKITRGHYRDLRVRACDRAGNCGSWEVQRIRG